MKWSDVDPQLHSFDIEAAKEFIHREISSLELKTPIDHRDALGKITQILETKFGPWASFWAWSNSEGGGGGPVRYWCCSSHSLFPAVDVGREPTIVRIINSVLDLRNFYEELEALFKEIHELTENQELEIKIEFAASSLMSYVSERTQNEDAWYNTFIETLIWFLEFSGENSDVVSGPVSEIVSGRFESWVAPSKEVADATFAEMGTVVSKAIRNFNTPVDTLALWMTTRNELIEVIMKNQPVSTDSHKKFIESFDRTRASGRADLILNALDLCRTDAKSGMELSWELMSKWQSIVLGRAAVFRTGNAYAKRGKEMYGISPVIREDFEACLRQANDDNTSLALRSARLFLDVCFFHPFEDGNGRAARLALDFILTRNGYGLYMVEPLFSISHHYSPDCLSRLTQTMAELVGPLKPVSN